MAIATLVMLLSLVAPVGWCQVDNSKPIVGGPFYLDSNADCNGPSRELYGQATRVVGHGAVQEAQSPTSCTLTLRSTANFDKTNLHIEVVAAVIRDCYVRLSIFDGEIGSGTLKAYDCNSPSRPNERDLVTTGDTVTFTLERRDSTNMLYDIEIFVTPITSGNRPGYENDYGQDFGFFREKLEAEEVVAVVSAAFALIIIVCTVLFFCCYRRYKGLNQKWETHQLSTFQPPPSTVYETKSRMSDTSSGVWASNMSRGASNAPSRRPVPPSSRMARASEDDESVFTDDTPPKQRLLERERQLDQERQRMERERRRGRGRDVRGFAIQNDSFVQADDDHPQDTFVERVIEPRVRPSRLHKPPSYEEAIHESETETEKSDAEEEEEEEEDDDDVDHKQSTEEEEEESEAASSQEEEDDDEDDEDTGRQAAAPKPAPRPKPQPQPQAVPIRPGMQPHPAYPGYPPVQYMGGYPMAPGQFVPIMAGPGANQFRPIAPGPGYPPPQYPGGQPRPSQPAIRPTDPPIYSYLVQRGYTPMDGRQSPASSANTSRSNERQMSDDPDSNILASGVEYMRR